MGAPEVLALCRTYGPLLQLDEDSGIDGPRLMAAIAWCESSSGQNMTPRYEAAYDIGGAYSENSPQKELLALWGKQAAYTYGPWQMLPCNARGFSPKELFEDNEKCALAFVGFFNRYVAGFRRASTLDQIFQTYNSGHFTDNPAPGVGRYVADGLHFYQTESV